MFLGLQGIRPTAYNPSQEIGDEFSEYRIFSRAWRINR